MFTQKKLGSALEWLGSGLFIKGLTDQVIFENDNFYNLIPAIIGTFCCITGRYLQIQGNPESKSSCNSTRVISQALRFTSGVGVVAGFDNLVRHKGNVYDNLGYIGAGLITQSAINELEIAATSHSSPLKWEKVRFIILAASDYATSYGLKKAFDGEELDLLSKVFIPVGFVASILEFLYGWKHDEGIDLSHSILRRSFKLNALMNFVFSGIDFINKNFEKYAVVEDIYSIIVGALLLAVGIELRRIACASQQVPELTNVIVEPAYQRLEDAKSAEQYNREGNIAFKKESYQEAISLFSKAINLLIVLPTEKEMLLQLASIFYNRASAHLELGNCTAAKEDLNCAMDIRKVYLDESDELIKKVEGKLARCSAAVENQNVSPRFR